MIESETLLENCPHCGALSMAARLSKPSTLPEIRFKCPKCGHQEFGRFLRAGSNRRLSLAPLGQEGRRRIMADHLETTLAPSAIERAMSIFEKFKDRDHAALVQARKALTDYIFGQVAAGQTDEQRLVVSGLTHLKSLEKMAEAGKT